MAYTIANSTAKNNYFTRAGVAIGATTQPDVNQATLAGILDSSLPANQNTDGLVSTTLMRPYTGLDRVNIMQTYTPTLRGSASTALRSPSDQNVDSIHNVTAIRTFHRSLSGFRAGLWNEYSGNFTGGPPGSTNDFAGVGADHAVNSNRAAPGEFTYMYASSGVQGTYPPKTN